MDLKDEPLLLATNPRGLDYDVAKVLSEASFTPRIEATSNLDHIIFSMVQHHLGISIEAALMLTDKENAAVLAPIRSAPVAAAGHGRTLVPHALPRRQPVCEPHKGGAAENGAGSDPVLILNCITIRGRRYVCREWFSNMYFSQPAYEYRYYPSQYGCNSNSGHHIGNTSASLHLMTQTP